MTDITDMTDMTADILSCGNVACGSIEFRDNNFFG